jgi:glycosyltransferase involved in cell wall biosynthesis
VLHPPVDTAFFTPDGASPASYFLVVSALVPYKRIDVAIDAAARAGVPLKIVGSGPDLNRLQSRAGTTVEFLGAQEGPALRELYRHARAFVLPGEEDFGIAPVEAMACGRPVIALGRGGATETVRPGVSGVLVTETGAEALAAAMSAFRVEAFDPAAIRAHAEQFGVARFDEGFAAAIAQTLAGGDAC